MPEPTSPYAPPQAGLDADRLEWAAGGPVEQRHTIDLSLALKAPFERPGWWRDAVVLGIVWCVPVVGAVWSLGWMCRVYRLCVAGQVPGLLPLDVGEDSRAGVVPLVASITTTLVIYAVASLVTAALMAIPAALASGLDPSSFDPDWLGGLFVLYLFVGQLPLIFVSFIPLLLGPELARRAFGGEWVPAVRVPGMVRRIRPHLASYITVLAGCFAAVMLMYAGMGILCVGFLLVFAPSLHIIAHLTAQWHQLSSQRGEPGPVPGHPTP